MNEKIWAVIPAYNEGKYIGEVIEETKKIVKNVVVVDDCSKDNSFEVAKSSKVIAIKNKNNRGAGYTTRVGCDYAISKGAEIIVTLDADGQHDPHEIPKLINTLTKRKYDIVFGARPQDKNMPFIKRIGNWGLTFSVNILFNVKIRDSQTGLRVFTKKAYPKLKWKSNRYSVGSEFMMRVGKEKLKYKEVTIKTIYNDKEGGVSKLDAVKILYSMLKWRVSEWYK